MPTTVKTLLASAMLLAATGTAQAQTAPSAAARTAVERQTKQLTQDLGLSPEQQGKLRNVLLLTRQHMDADLKAHAGDPEGLRTAMAYDRAKSEELIRGVLTPAQYARYQQIKASRISQLHVTTQTN